MKKIFILILLTTPLFSMRSYQKFYTGAENIGPGNSTVADSSSESGIVLNNAIIPTLYSTNRNFIFSYEVFSTFKLIDILALKVKYDFDIFPFVAFVMPKEKYGMALTIENLFYSPETTFYLRFIKGSFSFLILDNLSAGISPGIILATENNGYGYGYGLQTSFLWKVFENMQIGGNFSYISEIEWSITPYGNTLKEKFPYELKLGLSYMLNKENILYLSVANSFFNDISFELNNQSFKPVWATNYLYLLPAFGIRFLEKNTGGHISVGMYIDYYFTEQNIINQYFLTLGFRGYGKNFKYNLSFTDGYIINLFYKENIPRESINISLSFYF